MEKNSLKITDITLHYGHQSLFTTHMCTEDGEVLIYASYPTNVMQFLRHEYG